MTYGRLAQLVEHLLDVQEVTGSSPVPSTTSPQTKRSGDFFRGGGTGLEQQRRRPPPAAETGSRGWDRVLIFQSPAKGLRKNQQTQPVQAPAVRFRQGSQRIGMSTKKDAARLIRVRSFCFGGQYRMRTGTSKGRVSP